MKSVITFTTLSNVIISSKRSNMIDKSGLRTRHATIDTLPPEVIVPPGMSMTSK